MTTNSLLRHVVLRHVVLFKFKDDTTPQQVQQIEAAFRALPSKIAAIHAFEWGTDVSVEGIADGFTHCFFVTFQSAADRDAYLPHPAHGEFGMLLRPHLDKVLVLDYWAQTA
jgi:hypothetical protein